ncbi:DUF5403 family protein [Streptomyces sp. NPDC005774]|uniref:DUF5403 family protein n=1 Tax=Streptomyces sp. NPDC005774 TaxID=3364728 RepID=UPI003689BF12
MAELYWKPKPDKQDRLHKLVAELDGVQGEIWERTFEIAARAEAALVQHRVDGVAKIDMLKGDIDGYVVLEDKANSNQTPTKNKKYANSAASIEFGRSGYEVELVNERGQIVRTYEVSPSEGLHILTEASHLPKKQRNLRVKSRKIRVRVKSGSKKRKGGQD